MEPTNGPLRTAAGVGAALFVSSVVLGIASVLAPVGVAEPLDLTANLRIDSGGGNSSWPALAADPWGRVLAVWQDNRTGTFGIHWSRSLDFGATWAPDRRLDAPGPGGQSYQPDMAVDASGGTYNGSAYTVWQTVAGGAGDIWFARSGDGGVTWDPPVVLDQGPAPALTYRPNVAVGAGGRVFVVWFDNRAGAGFQVFFRSSPDGGATWTPEVQMSDPGLSNLNPVVAVGGDAVYVAWTRTDLATRWGIEIAASTDNGGTWWKGEPVYRLAPERITGFHIGTDPEADLLLAWTDSDASARQSLRYMESSELGLSFTAPALVATAMLPGVALGDVRVLGFGPAVAIAWSDLSAGDSDVYYAWREGATWSPPTRVDDTDRNVDLSDDASQQTRPALAGAGATLYFAWADTRNGGVLADIYAATAEWSQVLITEVQDAPDGQETVELYAWSRAPIALSGWTLGIDGATFGLGTMGSIAPGAHVTVGDGVATLRLSMDVNDEGARISVFDGTGRAVDVMGFGQRGTAPDPQPGASTARYSDASEYGRSWTWTAPPTLGTRNRVLPPRLGPPVVLNEILFNPSNPSQAFIELFYRGTAATTVTGLYLRADSDHALGPVDFTGSQPFFDLFASSAPALFASMDAPGDNVYLADTGGRLWDEAGWSSPHGPDLSMARAPDGSGTRDGFDDASSVAAGWAFDQAPSLPGISVGPDQTGSGDLGTAVSYALLVRSELRFSDDVELEVRSGPVGWVVDLLASDGVTPLVDSNGNGLPDLAVMAPQEGRSIVVVVHIPSYPPIGDTELTQVSGSARSNDMIRGNAWLTTETVPHVDPRKWATPTTIYVEGSPPPLVTQTTVHLEIVGAGQAIEERLPQDTIFLIDSSGSMNTPPWNSDPTGLRIDAVKAYIDGMQDTDRAAIVGFRQDPDYAFAYGAWLTNDVGGGTPTHLTWTTAPGKLLAKNNAETLRAAFGGTNIEKALQIAHQEFLPSYRPGAACIDYARPFPPPPAGGMAGHTWVEILLTDGLPSHSTSCTDDEVNVAAANGIRIFTIGLGDSVDAAYLQGMAGRTGGKYYKANSSADLLAIYEEIATFVSRIAGYDDNVNDDLPMVTDVVPSTVNIVPGSFRGPSTGIPKPPDWQGIIGGHQVLEWNVSRLNIGDVWSVEYRVSSPQVGRIPISAYPDARVTYLRWDGRQVTLSFPRLEIDVLAGPPKQVEYVIARQPARGGVFVDRRAYPAPARFTWPVGDLHEISVNLTDAFGPAERDLFDRWDDGGALTHVIAVGDRDTTITAEFVTQFRPRVALVGTDPAHTVAAHYSFHGQPVAPGSLNISWSDWVDAGSALRFDPLTTGSGPAKRWITVEDFSVAPWASVSSGLSAVVVYFQQAVVEIRTVGLGPSAPAAVEATAFGAPTGAPTHGTWTGWVDVGTPLGIENPVQVSPVHRYASQDPTSWTVAGPASLSVRYYRQWLARVVLLGLRADRPTLLRSVEFEAPQSAFPWDSWSGWVDDGGSVSVQGLIMAGPRERYRTEDETGWTITSAGTHSVQFVHEFQPTVTLLGTDPEHTVTATVHEGGGVQATEGVRGVWTGWVEEGGRIVFPSETSGDPPRLARDPTEFTVDEAFDGRIRYTASEVPEPNLKPLISLAYVVGIAAAGAAAALRRPLDLYLLPSRAARLRKTGRSLRGFRLLAIEDPALKLRKDRRLTFAAVALPFAVTEAAIGIVSLLTGFLRVPEGGTLLSLGLIVNTIILASALALDGAASRRGYRQVPPPPPDEAPGRRDPAGPARRQRNG